MFRDINSTEEIFRIANSLPALIWMSGPDKLHHFFNKSWLDFTGRTLEEETGSGWQAGIHPEDLDAYIKAYHSAFDKQEPFHIEYRLRRYDGIYRWMFDKGTPHFNTNNIFLGYTGGCMDIHAQKEFSRELEKQVYNRTRELQQINEELIKSEERYHRMVEEVEEYAILSLTKEGIIENWNKGAEKIKGYKSEEVIGQYFNIFYTPEDRKNGLPEKLLNEARERGTVKHEGWRTRKDKSHFWGYVVITALFDENKNIIGFSKVTRDLTDKKVAEDQLAESNKELQNKTNQLLEAQHLTHMGSWEWDIKEDKITWSEELYKMFGLTPYEIEPNYINFASFIHPDDQPLLNEVVEQAIKKHKPYHFTHRITRPDGTQRIISGRGKVFTDAEGNVIRLAGTAQDITEQKNYEWELKESEERFLKIFHNNPVPMTFAEIKTNKIKYANNLFCSVFGYTQEEVIGHTSEELQLLSPEENARVIGIILDTLQETRSVAELQELSVEETEELLVRLNQSEAIRNIEILYTRKNGEQFPAIVSYEVIRIGKEKYTITSYQDITERKKVELLLKHQNEELAKMNSELKSFAYISSHDLQEPLRKIQTFAGRILEKEYENLSENGKEQFTRMHGAAKRMQRLITDLLDYSRMSSEKRIFEFTDLSSIITEIKEELHDDLTAKNAVIETGKMCSINIIPFQFKQLMNNLISNSLKFSHPERPLRITIKSTIAKGHTFHNARLFPHVNYCKITVADNGIGFDPQYNERIFEVFQRLHGSDQYKGTGIGLAIVKKIVDNHVGIITASGKINEGATFHIYIPEKSL